MHSTRTLNNHNSTDLSTFRLITTYEHLKNETQKILNPEPTHEGTDFTQYHLRAMKTFSFFGWYDRDGKVESRSSGFRLRSVTSERVCRILVVFESVLLSEDKQSAEAVFNLLQLKNSGGQSIDHLCMYYGDPEVIKKYINLLKKLNKKGISKDRLLTLKETLYCSYSRYALELCRFFIDSYDAKKITILNLLLQTDSLPQTIKEAGQLETRDEFITTCQGYFEIIKNLAAQPKLPASKIMTLLNIQMREEKTYTLIKYLRDDEIPLIYEYNHLLAKLLVLALTNEPSVDAMSFKSYKEIVHNHLCRLPDKTPSERYYKKELLVKALNPVNGLGNFFYIKRGLRETHPSRGTLAGITKAYGKILAAEEREEIELESKKEFSESTPIATSFKDHASRRRSFMHTPLNNYGSFNDESDHSPLDSKSIFDYKQ